MPCFSDSSALRQAAKQRPWLSLSSPFHKRQPAAIVPFYYLLCRWQRILNVKGHFKGAWMPGQWHSHRSSSASTAFLFGYSQIISISPFASAPAWPDQSTQTHLSTICFWQVISQLGFCFYFLRWCTDWPRACYVAEVGHEFLMLLLPFSKCWEYRHVCRLLCPSPHQSVPK